MDTQSRQPAIEVIEDVTGLSFNAAITKVFIDFMEREHISKKELSERLIISRSAISARLAHPEANWSIDTMIRWAQALGCTFAIEFEEIG